MEQLSDPDTARAVSLGSASLVELLESVADGRPDAFGELYRRIAGRVFSLAKATTRDSSHAEDVTQEVFLEIWQRAATFDGSRGSASSWVLRLAHARSVDRVRQTQAARERDRTYSRREFEPDGEPVLDDVVRRADQRQLQLALSTLTTLQREALTLTFYRGNTYREASEVLGIPLATMKTRVRDGIAALRRVPRLTTSR